MAGYHSTKKLDLTSQRFGKLTVLNRAENIGSRTAWRCRCDCGQEAVVLTQHLRDGQRTSCGCDRRAFCEQLAAMGRASLTYIDGTCVEMIRSKTVRRNNTSCVAGVDWRPGKQRWRASICFKGERHYLGSYVRFEDAVQARKEAEAQLHDSFLQEYDGQSGKAM